MGADAFLLYYGLRYLIPGNAEDEVEMYETDTHPKVEAAKAVGLDHWWGNTPDDEAYFLLVGTQLGDFGWEGEEARQIEDEEFSTIVTVTTAKLKLAGFEERPALIAQFEGDH